MSRYYRIVTSPDTFAAPLAPTPNGGQNFEWTNQVNGKADLGAQRIELDVWAYAFDAPVSAASIVIWGPTKQQISQATDFNGAHIDLYAGMQTGLPLATAQAPQAGLILSGQILQAFGNWQGTNQTLNFVVQVDGGATQSKPANLVFTCPKGQPIGDALQQTLAQAYPGYKVSAQINSSLVLTQDEHHVSGTIQQFASYIKQLTQPIIGGNYPGVSITLTDKTFNVFDGSTPPSTTTAIGVQDLIGSPTWLDPNTVSFATVLRADMKIGSVITFPPIAAATAITTASSQSNARGANTFTGSWQISNIRHIGDSRAADANSWISVFQAISLNASPATTSVANASA